ncbi:hypothetical protein PPUN109347_19640 [Pseudomonas putida]|nr:hypothetical protein PPUN109347_19640 [Pseudomonas putida]
MAEMLLNVRCSQMTADSASTASTIPVGAGTPANTGEAGAMHRVTCFAGTPAPTENYLATRRYCCLGLRGDSGSVISINPAASAGCK